MKHLDLFSGIGGFALACDWAGIETIGFVEIDPFCQKVLNKHWPGVPIVEDINNVEEIKRIVDYATGQRHGSDNEIQAGRDGIVGSISGVTADTHSQRESQPEGAEQELRGRTIDRNQVITNTQIVNEGRLPEREVKAKSRLGKCCGASPDTISRRSEQRHTATRESFSKFGCEPITFTDTVDSDWQPRSTRENERGVADENKQSLILTAGFPCQPFSNAGRKRGADDNRYLWPQTFSVIESVKPDYVLLENVAGLLNMVFPDSAVTVDEQAHLFSGDTLGTGDLGNSRRRRQYQTIIGAIVGDLRKAGYETNLLVIPACFLGAPHRRDRVWIIASNTTAKGLQRAIAAGGISGGCITQRDNISDWQENWHEVAARFCRVDDGVPRIVDRVDRLKALGNAIVPQVAYQIIKGIQNADQIWFNRQNQGVG